MEPKIMADKNPFRDLDHIRSEPEGLRERVMRSAEDRKAWMAMAKMFTGDYMGALFRLSGGGDLPGSTEGPPDADMPKDNDRTE